MSEWSVLALAACILYLVECLAWIEAGAAACWIPPLGAGWRCARGTELPGNERGGLALPDPLRVGGTLVVSYPWPFSIDLNGIASVTADGWLATTVTSRYIEFDDIRTVRADSGVVTINGQRFVQLGSSTAALWFADQIEQVRGRSVASRAAAIRSVVAQTLDGERVASARTAFLRATRTLQVLSWGLLAYTFCVSPLVILSVGPYRSWKFLAVGLIAIIAMTVSKYVTTHRMLFPRERYERWMDAVSMTMLPLAGIRCVSKLSRHSLSMFGLVAVAATLCDREAARRTLRLYRIDLGDRRAALVSGGLPEPDEECALWFHQVLVEETDKALGRLGVDVHEPPQRVHDLMVSYCPRCHSQFGTSETIECPDCPGVHLASFPASPPPNVDVKA